MKVRTVDWLRIDYVCTIVSSAANVEEPVLPRTPISDKTTSGFFVPVSFNITEKNRRPPKRELLNFMFLFKRIRRAKKIVIVSLNERLEHHSNYTIHIEIRFLNVS